MVFKSLYYNRENKNFDFVTLIDLDACRSKLHK